MTTESYRSSLMALFALFGAFKIRVEKHEAIHGSIGINLDWIENQIAEKLGKCCKKCGRPYQAIKTCHCE